jgi:hypothetical protein
VILNIDEAFVEDVRETVEGNFKHCKTPFLSGLEVDRKRTINCLLNKRGLISIYFVGDFPTPPKLRPK